MSKKQTLIDFLQRRTTTFTINEVMQMIAIVSQLEEPKPKEDTTKKPNKKE